ncbi:MAG: restriction endonuclease subunit S [Anaerolineales bacterium]|nr:restriction endonuclease subunit S [Anaerolineales bacterium]
MKLNKKNWNHIPIGNVVESIEKHDKNPLQNGLSSFVGLEHIDGDSLKIIGSGSIEEGTTFTKIFQAGDVLFGKRRAYLRKVAVADFSGVCSGDILVLRAKESLNSELLPYYASSDSFINYAISTSAGSLSPRTKWRDLSNFEISFPPSDEQHRIVELFQSIEQSIVHTEAQEKNLRKLCKSLVDAFVSDKPYFGNLLKNKKLKKVYYRDIAQKLMRRIDPVEYGIERIVAGENLESEDFKIRTWGTVGKDFLGPAFHVLFQAGDILYGSRRTYLKKVALADFEGVCANTTYVIKANEEIILQDLLKHIMLSERFTQYSISVSKGSTNPYINWKDLDNFVFEIPDLETQKVIANLLDEILDNAEKVREQKETLKKLRQKLLNEILG